MSLERQRGSTPGLEVFQLGPDTITVRDFRPGELARVGNYRSRYMVEVNGILRAALHFPAGYGGAWTLTSLCGCWTAPRYRGETTVERAYTSKGEEARRELLAKLPELVRAGRFPTQLEHDINQVAAKAAEAEKKRQGINRDRTRYSVEMGRKHIARREKAEATLEDLLSIRPRLLTNAQAIALGNAITTAAAEVERIHHGGGWVWQRQERDTHYAARLRYDGLDPVAYGCPWEAWEA